MKQCVGHRCRPLRPQGWDPLVVADLDGDGEPEEWAADQYQLGRRRHALRILRRERRRGHLRQIDWYTGRNLGGRRYVRKLDRTLRRHGYGSAARRARSASTS